MTASRATLGAWVMLSKLKIDDLNGMKYAPPASLCAQEDALRGAMCFGVE
jgi:hypothetical protein